MRVYAAELICSTGVSGFQTFKPVFCIYNKLRLHAKMLSYWLNDVIFSRSNPTMSYRSVLNVSNGGPSNPKLTLKINSLLIKRKAQNFASWMLSEIPFQNRKKKRKWFFDHRTTLKVSPTWWIKHSDIIKFTFQFSYHDAHHGWPTKLYQKRTFLGCQTIIPTKTLAQRKDFQGFKVAIA